MAKTKSTPKSKICSRCQQRKHHREFHILRRNPDGLSYHCKDCEKALKQHYSPSPTRQRATTSITGSFWIGSQEGIEPAAFCKSCQRIVPLSLSKKDSRGYRRRFLICRPCNTAQRTAWHAEHPERDKATVLRNWHAHSEKRHISQRLANKKRLEDPVQRAKQYAAVAAWYAANPERSKTKNSKHRARIQNAPLNDVTLEQWQTVILAAQGKCAYCPFYNPDCKACKRGRHTGMTVDHITALANGGSNTLHNLVACCRSCNSKKYLSPAPILVQPLLL